MIARAVLSPLAISSLNEGTPAESYGRHLALCQIIEAHGFMVLANRDDSRELVRAVKASQPEALAAWSRLFKRFQQTGRNQILNPPQEPGVDLIETRDHLEAGISGRADLAVVSEVRASTAFGLATDQLVSGSEPTELEIVRAPVAPFAGKLAKCRTTSESGVLPCGTSRESFWAEVVGPIALVSRKVSITDRYINKNLKRRSEGGRAETGFLAWFIEKLNQGAKDGCELTIISFDTRDCGGEVGAEGVAETVGAVCPAAPGRLGKISMVATQPASYLPHDRHFLSSIGVGVTLHAGFDSFDSEAVRPEEGIEFAYRSDPKAVEKLQITERRYREDRSAQTATAYER